MLWHLRLPAIKYLLDSFGLPTAGIDTRTLGKPDTFRGEEAKWADWRVRYRIFRMLGPSPAVPTRGPCQSATVRKTKLNKATEAILALGRSGSRGPSTAGGPG